MSGYPKAFSYFLTRLNNFSRQKIRLATVANTSFSANDQIVIELPQGLVDLSTFTLQGNAFTADGAAHGVYMPPAELCIDNIQIEVGGVALQNGFSLYGDLFDIYRHYHAWDRKSYRQILQNDTHPTATASNYALSNQPFAIWNWLGFLSSVKVLDTTILPTVKLFIRLAPNSILTAHAGNASTKTYKWTNVKATVDLLDISDGIYYNFIKSRLLQAPLELPFDNYTTVVGSLGAVTSTTRWSTSADCLEMVLGTFKPVGYDSNSINSNLAVSDYFCHGGKDSTTAVTTSQMSVNGIRYPSIPLQNADGDVFITTSHSLGTAQEVVGASDSSMDSLARWSSNYWLHAQSFTYPDSEDAHRLTGLSGRGNQIIGTFELTGSGSNILPVVYLKHKSVLRIGNGKMVEVVL